jgi:hypothetical protein
LITPAKSVKVAEIGMFAFACRNAMMKFVASWPERPTSTPSVPFCSTEATYVAMSGAPTGTLTSLITLSPRGASAWLAKIAMAAAAARSMRARLTAFEPARVARLEARPADARRCRRTAGTTRAT